LQSRNHTLNAVTWSEV